MDVREWSPGARSSAYRGMLWAMTTSSQVPTLTLVVGPEQLLAERAVDEVLSAARRADPDTERRTIDCTEAGAAGTIAEACSPTLFGGGSVVIVDKVESADDGALQAIAGFAAEPTDGVAMVVLHAGGARGKKIIDRLAALASRRVDCPEVKGRAVAEFVSAEARRNKVRMSPEAQALLIGAVGSDVRALASACAQLASDIEGNQIDGDAVTRYFGGTVEVTGFQIADAVLDKKSSQALRLLRLAEGTEGARLGPATVASLANRIRQVIALDAAPTGMSDRDLAIEVRVPTWKLKVLRSQARRWHTVDLAKAMLVLGGLDAAVKGGLREGDQLEPVQKGLLMEQAVTNLGKR